MWITLDASCLRRRWQQARVERAVAGAAVPPAQPTGRGGSGAEPSADRLARLSDSMAACLWRLSDALGDGLPAEA